MQEEKWIIMTRKREIKVSRIVPELMRIEVVISCADLLMRNNLATLRSRDKRIILKIVATRATLMELLAEANLFPILFSAGKQRSNGKIEIMSKKNQPFIY